MNRSAMGVGLALLAAGTAAVLATPAPPAPPGALFQDQQRPIFRAETHFVSVDAYPTKNGKIIAGLTKDDFEIKEDGKLQTVETFDFTAFEKWDPDAERRDPRSQRESFDLAADPKYRVFVTYVNRLSWENARHVREPILSMLRSMLGPRDLFTLILPGMSVANLTLGQRTDVFNDQLTQFLRQQDFNEEYDPIEQQLLTCGADGPRLIQARRMNQLFLDLEGLVTVLGSIRQERKNVIFVSEGFRSRYVGVGSSGRGAVDDVGGRHQIGGRGPGPGFPGILRPGPRQPGEELARACQMARMYAQQGLDPRLRFVELLRKARASNVAFHVMNPSGLQVNAGLSTDDDLRTLAGETDGVAVVNTNDLTRGLKRIADDMAAYYTLGYNSSNTKWDGKTRKISVRLRPSGDKVRARREYRAPTEAEMAPRATPPPSVPPEAAAVTGALGALARLRSLDRFLVHGHAEPGAITVVAELQASAVESGAWIGGGRAEVIVTGKDGRAAGRAEAEIPTGTRGVLVRVPIVAGSPGPWQVLIRITGASATIEDQLTIAEPEASALVGHPVLFRATFGGRLPPRPVADFQFRRTETTRIEWPVYGTVDQRQARLLDVLGKPLAVPLTVAERVGESPVLIVDVPITPLAAADYVIELVVGRAGQTETRHVAIRVIR